MNHEQVFDLIPAYVLGALAPAEMAQVDEHLGHCAACQSELRAYQQIVDELPLAIRQRTPPASIKKHLMEQVKQPASRLQMAPARTGLLGWFSRLTPAWGLVSLALILVLAISNIWLWQRLTKSPQVGQFRVVALAGTGDTPKARGVLVISSDGNEGTLVVEDLPVLDPAQQYQLWLIRDGKRSNGGVFSVSETGYGRLNVLTPDSLLKFDAFGITIEPAGGSPGPTGKKVLGGNF